MAEFPAPAEGIVLTHFIVASDVGRSRRFYAEVLGGEVLREGEPSIVAAANSWIVINAGGPPTDGKPTVTLKPPRDPDHVSSFLNIRAADIHAAYEQWRARGAEFLTPPADRRHELRLGSERPKSSPRSSEPSCRQTADPAGVHRTYRRQSGRRRIPRCILINPLKERPEKVVQFPGEPRGRVPGGCAPRCACCIGRGVLAGDVEGMRVAERQERPGIWASGQASIGAAIQGAGSEVVQVGAGVPDTARGDHRAEQPKRLAGGCRRGEREDVSLRRTGWSSPRPAR